uniref:RING-type domain-containing protein n=1 Tax=Scophthalmus maximus TaxID=52904 RepID=A0A8D3CCH4_SCOMX
MPSSTSLLEADEGESEVPPPLVHAFAGMGLDEHHGTQSQSADQGDESLSFLHHQLPAAPHFSLLGTVLDLKPLPLHRPPSGDEVKTTAAPGDEESELVDSSGCTGGSLLAQAHRHQQHHLPSGPAGSAMPAGMEHVQTVLLYNGGDQDDATVGGSALLPPGGMAVLPPGVFGESGYETEASLLARRKSVNTTECVAGAELRARRGDRGQTGLQDKGPPRQDQHLHQDAGARRAAGLRRDGPQGRRGHGEEGDPVCGRALLPHPSVPQQDGPPLRRDGLGRARAPRTDEHSGATIKRIQQQTHTYIVTPSRDKEPVFEVTGMPENVDRAREEIEAHIALRTGTGGGIEVPGVDNNDFQFNGTDVSFENSAASAGLGKAGWLHAGASPSSGGGGGGGGGLLPMSINGTQQINSNINSGVRMSSNYRNDSSSSLGSGSSSADSFYGSGNGNRNADLSPTCAFNANANANNNNNNSSSSSSAGSTAPWFGDSLLPVGSEELVSLGGGGSSSGFDPLTISTAQASHPAAQPKFWSSFVDHQPLQAFDVLQSQTSQPGTPRLSPTFSGTEALEHPQAQRVHRGSFGSAGTLDAHRFPSYSSAFSSSSESTASSSSPPDSSLFYRPGLGSAAGRGQEICIHCMDNQVIAALVPCGHNLFCLDCATQICQGPEAVCPVCLSPVTQAIQLRNM